MTHDALENTAQALLSLGLGASLAIIQFFLPVLIFIYQALLMLCRISYHVIYQVTYTPRRESFAHQRLDRLPHAKDDYSESVEPYEYAPLSSSRSIRLLELSHPGPLDFRKDGKAHYYNEVHCRLVQVSLDNPVLPYAYRAISYTWDGQKPDRYILCHGKKLAITKNCELILQHFMRYARMYIWIDAICIDQGSEEEKSTQIPLMAQIYGRALVVNVWLGLPTQGTGLAISYIWLSWCAISLPDKLRHWMQGKLHRVVIRRGHARNLEDLIRRNWWRRVWTIQEATLARVSGWTNPVPVMVNCGHYEVPIDCLGHLLLEFNMLHPLHQGTPYIFNSSIWSHYLLSHTHPRLEITAPGLAGLAGQITTAMFRCRASNVFDPKDRIYGLYGIFTNFGITLSPPSPTKTKQELYRDFTREACQATMSLSLLSLVNSDDSTLEGPSWVPDFSSPFRLGDSWMLSQLQEDKYPATPPSFTFQPDRLTLRCTAVFLDRIKSHQGSIIWKPPGSDPIAHHTDGDLVNLENPDHIVQTLLTCRQWFYQLETNAQLLLHHYGSNEAFLLAFGNVITTGHLSQLHEIIVEAAGSTPLETVAGWMSILHDPKYCDEIFDSLLSDPRVPPETKSYLSSQIERLPQPDPSDPWNDKLTPWKTLAALKFFPPIARFTHTVWMHNGEKVLFVTEKGRIGSGNMSLKNGDAVVALEGMDKMMLLREVDGETEGGERRWRVVGAAFVEGADLDDGVREEIVIV